MLILSNAFSLSMIPANATTTIAIRDIANNAAAYAVRDAISDGHFRCAIGHADTAAIVRGLFAPFAMDRMRQRMEQEIVAKRDTITLVPGDVLIVAQYSGPRLPEGTTVLPAGAKIEFREVKIVTSPLEEVKIVTSPLEEGRRESSPIERPNRDRGTNGMHVPWKYRNE